MRILIILDNLYIPQYSGGIESCTHELAMELTGRGHSVAVVCRLGAEGLLGLIFRASRRLSGKLFGRDTGLGYPVYRTWQVPDAVNSVVAEFKPDVALIQHTSPIKIAHELQKQKIPVLLYLHDVMAELLDGDLRSLKDVHLITNSEFAARRYREMVGLASVALPPLFRRELYIGPRDPRNVTFINPHPAKGCELAFKIAERCHNIPFRFIQSWALGDEHLAFVRAQLEKIRNVRFQRRTQNMRKVYSQAKIVLVPSQCEEAWGRVASEAQFNGIPVVATNIGGLPESVGPGGILIEPGSSVDIWVEAVRRLWNDSEFYKSKSNAALEYSKRREIDTGEQVELLLGIMRRAIEGAPESRLGVAR